MSNIFKIFIYLVVALIALQIAAPAMAQLTLKPQCNPTLPPSDPNSCNIGAFVKWVKQIINFMLVIAIPIGVIFISYGGFVILTAGGNEERFKTGKKIITGAVIGLAIALGAWLIITSLNFFIKAPFQFK